MYQILYGHNNHNNDDNISIYPAASQAVSQLASDLNSLPEAGPNRRTLIRMAACILPGLVNSHIAIEHGHLEWIFPLNMGGFYIVMLVYQRVTHTHRYRITYNMNIISYYNIHQYTTNVCTKKNHYIQYISYYPRNSYNILCTSMYYISLLLTCYFLFSKHDMPRSGARAVWCFLQFADPGWSP